MVPNPETVSESAFERLVEGSEDSADIAGVLAYEANINLVAAQFLKDDCDALSQVHREEAKRLWSELETMHEKYPDEFEKMWQYPLVTARWRMFMDAVDDEGKVSEEQCQKTLLELSTITGALAIRCGDVSFEGEVAVQDDHCVLPTLGAAIVPSMGDTARLYIENGKASLGYTDEHGESKKIALPEGLKLTQESSTWLPIRQCKYQAPTGNPKHILLDDIDPYRECFGQDAIRERLTLEEAELWHLSLVASINRLYSGCFDVPYPPETVDAILEGVQVLVPLKPLGGSMATATSINALGAIGLSRAPDTLTLGEALIHEYQHTKLTGLLNQHRLFEPISTEAIYYAPWRTDPRPIMGVLHGLYASIGIMKYWQRQVQLESPTEEVSYAKSSYYSAWACRVQTALPTLQANVIPTETGQSVLRYLQKEVASIEALPPSSGHASIAVLDHLLSWQVNNCRPDQASIETLAVAFMEGRPVPIALHSLPPSIVERQQGATTNFRQLFFEEFFKTAYLRRDGLSGWAEELLGVSHEGRSTGLPTDCPDADAALVLEYPSSQQAQLLYREALQTADMAERRSLWPGYLVALYVEDAATPSLLAVPEVVCHLYEYIATRQGSFEPFELVEWLQKP